MEVYVEVVPFHVLFESLGMEALNYLTSTGCYE